MRFFLIGFMGSGKSYWGKRWSEAFGLTWYDLDDELEKAEGKSIASIFQQEGEWSFRKKERKLLRSFRQKDTFILSCGGGTPCFYDNLKEMNQMGVVIYLKSTPVELAVRLRPEIDKRPLLKGVAEDQLEAAIAQKLAERSSYYLQALYHLPTRFLSEENFERIYRRHAANNS